MDRWIKLEPQAVVLAVQAVVALVVTFGLSDEAAGVIMLLVIAVGDLWAAYRVKNTLLAGIIGLVKAVTVFLGYFTALDLSEPQLAALVSLVTVLAGFFGRSQTSPLVHGSFSTNQASADPVLTSDAAQG